MKRAANVLRLLMTLAFLTSILTPITTVEALSQETNDPAVEQANGPPTGTLQIWITGSDTGLSPGVTGFAVTDANSATQNVVDEDADGLITVPNLPVGRAVAQQNLAAPGYYGGGYGETQIVAEGIATINISNDPVPPPDADSDGVADGADNCVNVANGDQADLDGDGIGDACEPDGDSDGVIDDADNCVNEPNGDQADLDGDGIGDACDATDDRPTEEPTQEPTDEPTQEPTDEPTQEPTKEPDEEKDEPVRAAPGMAPMANGNGDLFTISCSYDASTQLSTLTFTVVKANPSDPDPDPNLVVTFQPYDVNMVPLTPIVSHTYTTTFPSQPWRQVDVTFTRPDGVQGEATATCHTDQNTTTLTTQALTAAGVPIPDDGGVPAGTAIKDSATLSGNTINAGGTATYRLYKANDCSGTPVFTQSVTVSNGAIPNSPTYTPTEAGVYNWQVSYSGDEINKPSTSACGSETVVVGKVTPTISTVMTTSGGTTIPDGGTVPLNTQVRDRGVLAGFAPNAGGTMTYNLYSGGACTGTPVFTQTVTVTNGVAPQSDLWTAAPIGTYNWQVVYSGDAQNESVTSACGAETFEVVKRSPTVATVMKNAANNATIADGGSLPIGGSAYDTATLGSATANAGGTVTYNLYSGTSCSGTPVFTSGPHDVTNGVIPQSGAFQFLTAGTYNWQAVYSGDDSNNGASSTCGAETLVISKVTPSIATVMLNVTTGQVIPDEGNVPSGSVVSDSATLTGASGTPTGTVRYRLYPNGACSGTPVYDSGDLPLNPDGTLPSAPPPYYTVTADGTYNWRVTYSGDANNNSVTSACGAETFYVGIAGTSISTQVKRGTNTNVPDGGTVTLGTAIFDTATLSGATANAGGTVTYNLYFSPTGAPGCTGTPVFTQTVTVTNRAVPNSGTYNVNAAGTYDWQVVYSGDANNAPSTSACGAETVVVNRVTPTVTTVMKNGATNETVADNATVTTPFAIYDTATLNGASANAGGTVTYNLYSGTSCSGTPVFSSGPHDVTNGVVPNSGTYTITDPGVYNWRAVYSGDANNNTASSSCGAETVSVQTQPAITTAHYASGVPIADGETIPLGSVVFDTATLTGTFPTGVNGTVRYNLYANDSCSGTAIFTSQKTVTVDSTPTVPNSDTFTVNFSGIYTWQAVFTPGGTDTVNKAATSACGSETFIVAPGTPTITTVMKLTAGNETIPQNALVQLPASVYDTAVLSGTTYDAGGTITYKLYLGDCSPTATPIFTSTKPVTNHVAPASDPFNATTFGTYNWVVEYSGDANNPPMNLGCGNETFTGVEEITRTIDISCTYFPESGTVTFRVLVAKINTAAPDYDPQLTVVAVPTAMDNSLLPAVTYHNYDSNVGPNNPNFVQQPWRFLDVTVTWPDGATGNARAGCNSTKLTPSLSTLMVTSTGGTIANGDVLALGTQVGDTVTATGGTINMTGSVTYNLYNSSDCSGTPVFTDLQPIVTPGVLPPSAFFTLNAVGTYNWRVTYSGDAYNEPVTSGCNEEFFSVRKNPTSIVTVLSADDVLTGQSAYDTAVLSGATADAGGTVTYYVYGTGNCTGVPVYTLGPVAVTNGVVANSPSQIFPDAGNYQWQAVYSGDAKNEGSASACGTEPFTVLEPGIEILKSCPVIPDNARVGDPITFTVTIRNTGDVPLTEVAVTETRTGTLNAPFPTTLAVGQVETRTFTSTITATDVTNGNVDNTATVTALARQVPLSDSDTANCLFNPVEGIDIEKSCPVIPEGTRVGTTISYTVTIRNTGDVLLTNIVVTETRAGTLSAAFPTTLAAGASATRTFTTAINPADAVAGKVVNTAIVTATALQVQVSDSDLAECPFNPVEGIDIEKSCPAIPDSARIGDPIAFTVTVINTGDVPLTNVAVTETRAGTLNAPFPTTLAVGQAVTRTFTSTITAADAINGNVDNTASVSASALGVPVSDSDTANCLFNPVEGIEILKSCPVIPDNARVGAPIAFTVTIRNTGDVPLTEVAVTETRAGTLNAAFPTTLGVGASATRTFTSTITAQDVLNGNVNNTATVAALALQVPVSDSDTAECLFNPVEGIEILKSCPVVPAGARAGDPIAFTVTIRNTGDVALTNVVVTETRGGTLNAPFPTTLGVGQVETRIFTSTITLADAAAGNVNNTASVTAQALQVQVSDSDTANCPFNPVEGIEIAKSCPVILPGARIGDPINFTVTVINTGDTPLSSISVNDDRAGSFDAPFPTTLAVGQAVTRTFTSTITAQDAINGNVDNTASVSASALGVPVSDSDTARCLFNPVEGIEILKSCPVIPDNTRVGAPIAFTVTIRNTGDVPLTEVAVTETRAGTLNAPFPTTLAVGESAIRTFTSTITAADAINGNVDNTASVSALALGVPVSDSDTANCLFNPVEGIEILKSCPVVSQNARVGDPITFTVTIRNTGDVALTNVVVTETRGGTLNAPFPTTLGVGASATRTFTSTITAQDVLNGNVNNTATVAALALQVPVSDSDTAECLFNPVEGIEITKSCPVVPAGARAGDPITYTVTIRNIGDVTLTNVVVTESRPGTLNAAFPTTLDIGQAVTRTFTSTITLADAAAGNVDNTASVTALALQVQVSDSDTANCPFTPVRGVDIEKSCPVIPDGARAGDPISFLVTLTNTGDVTLTDIVVTDTRAGTFDAPFPSTLAPNTSVTRTFTSTITLADAAAGNVNNTVSVSTGQAVGDSDTAECPFNPVEGIEILKSCPVVPEGARAGDPIAFTVTIRNTGDTVISDIVVTETRTGTLNAPFPTTLAVGQEVTRTFTSTITLADAAAGNVDNTASVTGNALGVEVTDSDTANCPFNPVEGIEITKSCPVIAEGARAGDPITYSVTIRNTGDTVISNIVVTDSRPGSFNEPFPTTLAVGASATRTFTSTITLADAAAGNVDNTASVTGNALGVEVTDSDTANCPFNPVEGIEITKSCPVIEEGARAGDPIAFTVTIRNTGDTVISDIVVTESRTGTLDSPFPTSLNPGQTETRTFTSTITLADAAAGNVDNTASVTGNALGVSVSDSDTAECPFNPVEGIEILKSCPVIAEGARAGDPISFLVTIRNTGDTVISDIVVTETRTGTLNEPFPTTLAVGESATRTFTSTITLGDAAAGNVDNTASVTGNALGVEVSDSDTAECPFNPVEGIEIIKSCPVIEEGARASDPITYSVTIRNIGDTVISSITVTDSRDGSFDEAFPTTLAVGESATRTFTSTITLADAAAGNVDNTASVTGNALGVEVTDSDTANCPFNPVEGIEITKSCPVIEEGTRAGDPVSYIVTITNTGDTVISDIVVTETRDGTLNEPFPTTLAVGETATRTFTSTITLADAAAGNVDNTATVTGNALGVEVTDSDMANCPLIPGKATVYKYTLDRDGNEVPLEGVCFELRQNGSTVYGPACTDADGIASFGEVKLGTYQVVEASAPPGYDPAAPIDITVGYNETVGVPIANIRGTVGFPVYKLDCQTDPGPISAAALFANPNYVPEGCVRVPGVAFWVTIDGELLPNQFVTGADGSFQISVQVFSSISISEDLSTVTPGYLPREATITIDNVPVEGVDGLVFVNLPQDGNVKIIKYVCKAEKPTATRFEITDPTGMMLAGGKDGHHDKCWRGANVTFTITGDNLAQPIRVTTDRNGELNISLRAGTYTVVEDATGATATFTVVPNVTTVIKVTNFKEVPPPPPSPTPPPTKPTPEPITDLPDTGAGGASDNVTWLLLLLTLGLGGLATAGLLALSLKRQKSTRTDA